MQRRSGRGSGNCRPSHADKASQQDGDLMEFAKPTLSRKSALVHGVRHMCV